MDLFYFILKNLDSKTEKEANQQRLGATMQHWYVIMDSLDLNLFGFDKILAVTCVLQLQLYFSLLFLGLLSAVSASAAH